MFGMINLGASAQTLNFQGGTLEIQNGASLVIEGNLNMNGTGTFLNNGTIKVAGNIDNALLANSFTGTGSVELNGTSAQAVNGTSPLKVNGLIINNASGVTLNNSLQVEGVVDFTSGKLMSSNTNTLVFKAGSSIGTMANSNSYVVGPVIKEGTGAFNFPVGNTSNYQPVSGNFAANAAGVKATYNTGDISGGGFTSNANGLLSAVSTGEYWDISPVSTATGTVTLFFDGVNASGLTSGMNDYRVAHKIGGAWVNEGGVPSGTIASGSVTSGVISTWSPFAVGSQTATTLSVRLKSFKGKSQPTQNLLTWKTSSEISLSHFEIEKSNNGTEFKVLGKVAALNKAAEYSFVDKQPSESLNYYKLKSINNDGTSEYTKIVILEGRGTSAIVGLPYPNPSESGNSQIELSVPKAGTWSIKTFDATGIELSAKNINLAKGLNNILVNTKGKGVFMIQLENGSQVETRKLIVK